MFMSKTSTNCNMAHLFPSDMSSNVLSLLFIKKYSKKKTSKNNFKWYGFPRTLGNSGTKSCPKKIDLTFFHEFFLLLQDDLNRTIRRQVTHRSQSSPEKKSSNSYVININVIRLHSPASHVLNQYFKESSYPPQCAPE